MVEKQKMRVETILLVEDEEDHARLIMKTLQEKTKLLNPIHWVKNGEEALAYITKTGAYHEENAPTPGLILLDLKLPLKDGFEVLQEIKSDSRYKTIPVIMLTTSSQTDDIRKALELGANDYIVKPIQFHDFVDKIGSLGHYWICISDSKLGHFV